LCLPCPWQARAEEACKAVQGGDVPALLSAVSREPCAAHTPLAGTHLSPLHVAAQAGNVRALDAMLRFKEVGAITALQRRGRRR
jgi:hypothetical protein